MQEIWHKVKDYEKYLEVSNLGNVRTIDRNVSQGNHSLFIKGKLCSLRLKKNGYLQIDLRLGDKKRKWFLVHRLVAIAFIKNPKGLKTVDHINNNKQDNRVENLQWLTNKDNTNKAVKDGLCSNEEAHYKAKLTKEQIISIRQDSDFHWKIAEKYKVARSTITAIKNKQTWKYVETEK